MYPSDPETQAVRNQQYLSRLLFNENESDPRVRRKCVAELTAALDLVAGQSSRVRRVLAKNGKVVEELNLSLERLRSEKTRKLARLSEMESRLRSRERVDGVANEILLLGDTRAGLKVLCARYSGSRSDRRGAAAQNRGAARRESRVLERLRANPRAAAALQAPGRQGRGAARGAARTGVPLEAGARRALGHPANGGPDSRARALHCGARARAQGDGARDQETRWALE